MGKRRDAIEVIFENVLKKINEAREKNNEFTLHAKKRAKASFCNIALKEGFTSIQADRFFQNLLARFPTSPQGSGFQCDVFDLNEAIVNAKKEARRLN